MAVGQIAVLGAMPPTKTFLMRSDQLKLNVKYDSTI